MTFSLRAFLVAWATSIGLGSLFGLPAGLLVGQVTGAYPQGDRVLGEGGSLLGLEAARHLFRDVGALPRLGLAYLAVTTVVMMVPWGLAALDAQDDEEPLGAAIGRVLSRLPGLLGTLVLAGIARVLAGAFVWGLAVGARAAGSDDRKATLFAAFAVLVGGVALGAVRLFQETVSAAHLVGDAGWLDALGRGTRAGARVWLRGTLSSYTLTLATLGAVAGAAFVPTESWAASLLLHAAVTGLVAAGRTWLVGWCARVVVSTG